MELSKPALHIETKISNKPKYNCIKKAINVLRSQLNNGTILEDLQRINCLQREMDKYCTTAIKHIGLPRVGYGNIDMDWFLQNIDYYNNTKLVLQLFNIQVDSIILYEFSYGSPCGIMYSQVPHELQDGVGPLLRLYGEPTFCSPSTVCPTTIISILDSRKIALELITLIEINVNKIINDALFSKLKSYCEHALMTVSKKLRDKIINGYNPTLLDEDKIFLPNQQYSCKYEFQMATYQAYKIIKWLNFWRKEGFDISIRKEIA